MGKARRRGGQRNFRPYDPRALEALDTAYAIYRTVPDPARKETQPGRRHCRPRSKAQDGPARVSPLIFLTRFIVVLVAVLVAVLAVVVAEREAINGQRSTGRSYGRPVVLWEPSHGGSLGSWARIKQRKTAPAPPTPQGTEHEAHVRYGTVGV